MTKFNHGLHDMAFEGHDTTLVSSSDVGLLRFHFDEFLEEHPEALADTKACQLTKNGYQAAIQHIAEVSEGAIGIEIRTTDIEHAMVNHWGFWCKKKHKKIAKIVRIIQTLG
jgi:hypothetical protein